MFLFPNKLQVNLFSAEQKELAYVEIQARNVELSRELEDSEKRASQLKLSVERFATS